jgi:hypothetical protein
MIDFSDIDFDSLAASACQAGTHWNGFECVPDVPDVSLPTPPGTGIGGAADLSDIDWAGLAALFDNTESTLTDDPAVTPTDDPVVDWYAQTTSQDVVDAYGTDDAVIGDLTTDEQAWLDAAIESGAFMGDLGAVEGEGYTVDPATGYILDESGKIAGTGWKPGLELDSAGGLMGDAEGLYRDERYQGRIDLAESLLQQGYTAADIEQFLGMESLLTSEELGTVQGERLDSFEGVGTKEWFEFLADDPAVMADEDLAQGVLDALARIEDTGTATLSWLDSPEFADKYKGKGGGDRPKTPEELCNEDDGTWANGVCITGGGTVKTAEELCNERGGTWNGTSCDMPAEDPSGCDPGYQRNASGQCVLIEQITDADTCPPGQMRDASGQCVNEPPPGVPVYVNEQVDAINIVRNQLKDIKDAHNRLLKSGLANIDDVEQALTDAESDIYAKQYGVLGPDGELLSPGEMDRLLSTWESRRATSKKNRTADRAEILSIMTDEGVPAGLAQSELDMIQAIHGDSVDAQYDYIDSLWRIGKMSHDERTSMIGNMMASYRLQLRDTLIEMVMGEEISAAEEIGDIRQTALQADTMADLFEGMTENEVFALMSSGMSDLLQLPADKEIGMIETGEWAGYTEGEKSNVLLNAGYVQGADGLWTAPAAEEEEAETTYKKTLPDGVTPFEGTPQEYFQLTGERMFAPGEDPADDLGSFRADVGVLRDMGYGDWLDGQIAAGNLTVEGATVASVAQGKVTPASDGYVNINWADYPTEFDAPITPKEEAEVTYQLPLSRFTSSAAELTGMGATVSGDTVSLSPQLATDLMALGILKDVEEEEDPYDPFERFNTGLTVADTGGLVPFGAEDRDGELWMTPDGYSKFVDEMNYEEPDVPTHGVDAGVSLEIAMSDIAPPNYYGGTVRPSIEAWNDLLAAEEGRKEYEDWELLAEDAVRFWADKYVTEAKIIAHMDNRIVYGREQPNATILSVSGPGHVRGTDAPAGKPYFAAVPVANGRIAMIYASSEQAVKDAVKQAYPDKR